MVDCQRTERRSLKIVNTMLSRLARMSIELFSPAPFRERCP
jgi:hypothetical protein